MGVPHQFQISSLHFRSVFIIFLCTMGQLYSAFAIPSASSSGAIYDTDVSQSASALASTGNHDNPIVFVNHHHPDLGKKFAGRLSKTLISNGLRLGTPETASVYIAIFSKNYAKSSYCLNELLIILKSGITVIPVFYDVDTSDLDCHEMYGRVLRTFRWTAVKNGGLYDEDLRMLEEEKTFDPQTRQERPRYDANTVTEWRKALADTAEINGFELRSYNGDEGRLIHDIVKHVLSMKRVPKTPIHSYDVFLNHRGKDVKNTLASNLYYRLRDQGLRVFFDKEEMQKGNRINFVIENAIKRTHVHIAIFSTGYAQSEWCMDELLLMIESGSIIIPVFYDVKPTDMWSNGVYAEALRILKDEKIFDREAHQEKARYQSDSIERWKKALMEVTGREGLKLETYDGDEGKLVDMIVQEVGKYKSKGRCSKFFVKDNVSSSEWERYIVMDDPNACRRSSYLRKQKNKSFM